MDPINVGTTFIAEVADTSHIVSECCRTFEHTIKKAGSMDSVQTKTSASSERTDTTSLSSWNTVEATEEQIKGPCLLNKNPQKSIYFVHLLPEKKSENSKKSSKQNEEFCRICHAGGEDEALISPCNCSGSAQYAHQSCLLSWFELKEDKICEICLYEVVVKQTGFKPLSQWRLPWRSCDIVSYLFTLYCVVLLVFIAMVLWIASKRCLSPICVVLYFSCCLAISYFTYCCGCMEHVRGYWKSWIAQNRQWLILGPMDVRPTSGDVLRPKNDRELRKTLEEIV